MLSDRHRRWVIPAILLALLALGQVYARAVMDMPHGWRRYVSEPAVHDGERLVFPTYTVTRVVGPGAYEISKTVRDVPVVGDASGLVRGDTISVAGTFDASGPRVIETRHQVHRLRPHKQMLGFVGVLWGLIALPIAYRWRARRLVPRA